MSNPAPAGSAASAAAPLAAAPQTAAPVPAPAPSAPAIRLCDNCGASSVPGRYCGACGQRLEPPIHSLWHFLRVAAEDLTHADSRLWRTLIALLLQPGFLTREFLDGRRARYLPPVRLYLVLSVAFFLWASATRTNPQVVAITVPDHGAASAAVEPLTGEKPTGKKEFSVFSQALPGESPEQRATRICAGLTADYDGPWARQIVPAWRKSCPRIVIDNGRSLQAAFLHNLPRAMFLFLPLLAGVMMLLYWRPRHYYVEHLLLFVHNHAFVFLVVMLAWAAGALVPPAAAWIDRALALYVLWYVYRSMRVVYGQGRWLTSAKLVLLAFLYLVSGAMMLALTSVYSALTL
ncbi:MAG TPA: DUF3667 domain-containing protein [Steroidobacteraceae bacterium]|jgi:hypothetical protein|nr:DUF3667 domain-containing protein [Steroidobacteraceae bacterium]